MIRLKVCGMRDNDNIQHLLALSPDYMGFIFYEKSARFVGDNLDEELLKSFPKNTKKVGVFVNASIDNIVKCVKKYQLDYVQLHGEEMPEFCRSLRLKGISIIRAFSIDETFNFAQLNNYKPFCDYFLFDAKGVNRGGNGIVFDWSLLKRYDNEKPFFLAGGIDLENIQQLDELKDFRIHAIDVNSRFETAPAYKNIEKIKELTTYLRPATAVEVMI
jgi:phosphoribosylanthranilate isomerase